MKNIMAGSGGDDGCAANACGGHGAGTCSTTTKGCECKLQGDVIDPQGVC